MLKKKGALLIIAVNIIVIAVMLFTLFTFLNGNRLEKLDQAVSGLQLSCKNISRLVGLYFANQQNRLNDARQYIDINCESRDQALAYLLSANSDAGAVYELIDCSTYKGIAAITGSSTGTPVDYSDVKYLSLQQVFDSGHSIEQMYNYIDTTPEFLDSVTKQKSLAFYSYVTLGGHRHVLLAVIIVDDMLTSSVEVPEYAGSGVALVNGAGTYIINTGVFSGNDVYSYIIASNGSVNDINQMTALKSLVLDKQYGNFEMKNAVGDDCVYIYNQISGTKNWFYFVMVPYSSLIMPEKDYIFIIMVCSAILLLAAADGVVMLILNKKLRKSLERAEISAQKAQSANLAKSNFLARMSHDMRTPMNGVLGMTSLTLAMPEVRGEMRANLQRIEESGQFLLSLLNDTLDMSRLETNKLALSPAPTDVEQLLASLSQLVAPLFDHKNIEFTLKRDSFRYGTVLMDSFRVRQILQNLLSNSAKFTGNNGHVSLSVQCETAGSSVTFNFTVSDDGIGIGKDFLPHAFLPFEQESGGFSAEYNGTGLGLSIAKSLVDLMGGAIKIESSKGVGTTVSISLVFPTVSETNSASQCFAELNGKHFLICEDNPLNAEIAVKLLERQGVKSDVAPDGSKGVDMFVQGSYDLVIMDIHMPVMNGLDATRAIRSTEKGSSVPIVAMTANTSADDMRTYADAGMNGLAPKPLSPLSFYATLCKCIRKFD